MKWLKKLQTWWFQRHNQKQQELADLDTWLYGVGFLKIDSNGRKTRIDPLKLYHKANFMAGTYDKSIYDDTN